MRTDTMPFVPGDRVFHPGFDPFVGWVERAWPTGYAHVRFDGKRDHDYVRASDMKLVVDEVTYPWADLRRP